MMQNSKAGLVLLTVLLAACGQGMTPGERASSDDTPTSEAVAPITKTGSQVAADPPVAPIEPGQPGGLAADGTPVSEAAFTADSPQGAANIVQTYFALVEEKKYPDALALRADPQADLMSPDQFAQKLGAYREYHAQVGGPGGIQGAAGSSYVEVPVQVYGRDANGEEFHRRGSLVLKRSNNIPGATAEQLKWRIASAKPENLLQ